MSTNRFRLVVVLSVASLIVSIAIGVLAFNWNDTLRSNQRGITQQQRASLCWDEVLVVALHDHLTPPQRQALIARANHCADITR